MVWPARLFGPASMIIYILSFLLNFLFQIPFRRNALSDDAYQRICFEEWAYWAGSIDGDAMDWGGWFGGFLLTLVYCGLFLSIPIGLAMQQSIVRLNRSCGACSFTCIRAV